MSEVKTETEQRVIDFAALKIANTVLHFDTPWEVKAFLAENPCRWDLVSDPSVNNNKVSIIVHKFNQ